MATRAQIMPEAETREWFTAAELAELALPGLPADKRSINRRAREERWAMRTAPDGAPLVRPRAGRGGGLEYHVSLMPGPARIALAERGLTGPAQQSSMPERDERSTLWDWFGEQSGKAKATAKTRLDIVAEIATLEESGCTRSTAVAEAGRRHGVGKSTLWNWMGLINGVARIDWLPALAPRHQGGGREADIDPDIWDAFIADVLRPEKPTLTSCYDRACDVAAARGLSLPSEAAFRRRLKRDVPQQLITYRREGPEALRRSVPALRRTVKHLHALEIVNIDGHKFDVFVRPPWGGDEKIRPIAVTIQDVMSSKILAWCLDISENAIQTQLAFRDLFTNFGIPRAVLLDNGRAFASKTISGGAPTRFRFKIRDDEPTGVLMALDINPMWALPYRGQSKPIERAFRDMADRVSRHPAAAGAYTGNSPENKPHNYGQRVMEWDEFAAHVSREIARHNARAGRTGRHYSGRSFDEVFAESYATAPIRKASAEELRMALLTAQPRRVSRQTSEIELYGNRYWTPPMMDLAGERVMVRFDPENLHSEVHLFTLDGKFLMTAPVIHDCGFDSKAGAQETARRVADVRKRTRELEQAHIKLDAAQVAAMQPDVETRAMPEPTVIRPVRHRGQTAAALKAVPVPLPQRPEKTHEKKIFAALSLVKPVD